MSNDSDMEIVLMVMWNGRIVTKAENPDMRTNLHNANFAIAKKDKRFIILKERYEYKLVNKKIDLEETLEHINRHVTLAGTYNDTLLQEMKACLTRDIHKL